MRKPVNKFAVLLWLVAALALLSGIAQYAMLFETARRLAAEGSIWRVFSISLLSSAQLAGIGMIIELLDRIHWDAQQRRT